MEKGPIMQENKPKLKVINIGIETFYDALVKQGANVVQVEWRPPVKADKEMTELLNDFL